MAFSYDADIETVLAAGALEGAGQPVPERGNALQLRAISDESMNAVYGQVAGGTTVSTRDVSFVAEDGLPIQARWYEPQDASEGNAVVYAHGGGMIAGSVQLWDQIVRNFAELSNVRFLSVDYRLAPENRGDRPARDILEAIKWLRDNAEPYGVDPDRIAVMGDSAGGGAAAGAAILARDNGIGLARQILIYPMLDHHNVEPDPELANLATWNYDNNFTGWSALLPDASEAATVRVASPARLSDHSNLAPAYIDVGELDIFRDESVRYALALYSAGVSCELHVHPGSPHAFDLIAPAAQVSQRAMADRERVLKSL